MTIKITPDTTKAIRKWLKKNGFSVSCRLKRGKSAELEFDPNYNLIYVPETYDGSLDDYFVAWLKDHGLDTDLDVITLSILHEVGHSETFKVFTEKEWLDCAAIKELIYASDTTGKDAAYAYWNVSDEFAANMWLIMFVKAFYTKAKKLSKKIHETVIMGE